MNCRRSVEIDLNCTVDRLKSAGASHWLASWSAGMVTSDWHGALSDLRGVVEAGGPGELLPCWLCLAPSVTNTEDTSPICHLSSHPPSSLDITTHYYINILSPTLTDQTMLAANSDGNCQRIFFYLHTFPRGLRLITKFSQETNFLEPPDKL